MKIGYKIAAFLLALTFVFGMASCKTENDKQVITAYDIAVKNGFDGTEQEWLESLKGKDGDNASTVYVSLYEEACEKYGYTGTFYQFVSEYFSAEAETVKDQSVSRAADTAVRSAVSIFSTFVKTTYTYNRRGEKTAHPEEYTGAGSGVIVSLDEKAGDAYILTNFHVIYDTDDDDGYANEIKLYVFGRELSSLGVSAELIGATATYDVALLKVENSEVFRTSNLLAAEFADSNLVGAGDAIFAVGNPEAEGISVTAGIVSVDSEYIKMTSPKDERTKVEYRVIRIDAAVNGGNSGGGLFDLNGNLVGIVNAKIVSDEIDNIAYAIPSSIVKNVYQNILENCDGNVRTITRCTVGVTIAIKNSYAYYDPVLRDTRIKHIVEVNSIDENGAAYGKLKAGDILLSFTYNGEKVNVERMYNLTDYTLLFKKGETVTFEVERNGEQLTVPVIINTETAIA